MAAQAPPPPLPCPPNLQHLVSRQGYNLTDTAFRVCAYGANSRPINQNLIARFPNGPTTNAIATAHLLGYHFLDTGPLGAGLQSPWLSLFRKWQSMLDRIDWFFTDSNPQAARVEVHVVDLEKCNVIPATALLGLLPPHRAQTVGHELLLWRGVPAARQADIVMATFHVMNTWRSTIPIHLGTMVLPQDVCYAILAMAAGTPITPTLLQGYFARQGPGAVMLDECDTLRVVQALCTEREDNISASL